MVDKEAVTLYVLGRNSVWNAKKFCRTQENLMQPSKDCEMYPVYGLRRKNVWSLAIEKELEQSTITEKVMMYARILCSDPRECIADLMLYNDLPEEIWKQPELELHLGNNLK